MDIIKNYVRNNSQTLFKNVDTINNVVFDNRGFFFSKEAEIVYNQIKDLPHLYVAWTESREGFYYVGKSFQNGGRWKRSHAYHLGTLAHHLLDTIRYDDQNHQHWIDNWMQIETLNLGNNEHFIQLHQEVKICFIPFKLYSGQGFNTLDKNEIRPINKKIEEDLIKSYLADGLKLLNVQNNRNVKFSKEKRKITDIPKTSIKTKKVVNSLNNNNNNCVEFKVQQDESIAIIAGNIQNLPVGCCTIEIMNPLNGQNLYIQNNGNPIRTIRTLLRTVTEYFIAGDANGISKWQVVQNEMIQHNIQEIKVRVCSIN